MDTRERAIRNADPRIGFFDGQAEGWDDSGPELAAVLELMKRRAALLGLHAGESVLEVGCGTGQLTGWLAEQVRPGRVVGVDFSPEMLRKAQSKAIPATFRLADVCQDDLGLAEFDLALCFHSFPHFRDQPAALHNLARSLKSGGCLVVMHLHGRDEVNSFHHGVGGSIADDFLPDEPQWRTWLEAAGFRPPQISDGPDGFFLRAVVDR
jgi:ubiquinone/menaquinone biosynthesis C-methylase UbiE